MGIASDIRRGLRTLERALDNPVLTWRGNDYPCVPSMGKQGKLLSFGGRSLQDDLILRVRKDLLPDPGPQLKDLVRFQGQDLRIVSLDTPPGDPFLGLVLTAPAKGL